MERLFRFGTFSGAGTFHGVPERFIMQLLGGPSHVVLESSDLSDAARALEEG